MTGGGGEGEGPKVELNPKPKKNTADFRPIWYKYGFIIKTMNGDITKALQFNKTI